MFNMSLYQYALLLLLSICTPVSLGLLVTYNRRITEELAAKAKAKAKENLDQGEKI